MRILVNQHVAFGARTGIGHYTRELLRAFRGLTADDQIDVFPSGLLGKASRVAAKVARPRGSAQPTQNLRVTPGLLGSCRQRLLGAARPVERMVVGACFR